ncbi:MAG TPA: BON domain-containing protein [Pyrinomonadaceae bacterium]|jgi:hypothetical protein
MSYDEEQQKRSRIVVETPAARREVVQTVTARVPERRGVSTGVVAALVIGSVALVTLLFLFLMNRQSDTATETNTNVRTTTTTAPTPLPQQQPVIIQQPMQQQPPSVIVQQPATTTQPPVVIEQPSSPAATSPATTQSGRATGTDDTSIQSSIDKRMAEDATLSTIGVTTTVINGKVTLIGTVETEALKNRVEKLVRAIKGVRDVDNQIIVSAG